MLIRSTRFSVTLRAAQCVVLLILLASVRVFSADIASTNVCFNNPDNYANPHVYYWNQNPAGAVNDTGWPGEPMTEVEGYYCYDFGVELNSLKVIFNDAGYPQSGDLDYLGGGQNCWDNGAWRSLVDCGLQQVAGDNFVVYFRNDANYAQPYIHFFDMVPARAGSQWPGEPLTSLGGDWYSKDFAAPVSSGGAVFSDNGAPQTNDLALNPATPCFQNNAFVSMEQCDYDPNPNYNFAAGNALYFVNSAAWPNPTAYIWAEVPAGSVADSGWPGAPMTDFGGLGLWYVDLGTATTQGKVIFSNNGQNQTGDLDFFNGNFCYNNGIWMTPQECGVPSQTQANAGPDRLANQNSRIALSAAATPGITSGAVWSSDAWSGDIAGATAVSPVLTATGSFTVTLTLDGGLTDTFALTVVSPTQGLPERPLLAEPLAFPTTGSVSSGNFEFESAFANLDGMFQSPVMVTNDGTNDLIYVVDKQGTITVFPNDPNVTTAEAVTLLDIRNEVRNYHEQGLLSIAFHPQFAQNRYVYMYYIEGGDDNDKTGNAFSDGVLQRITLNSASNPTSVVAGSRVDVLRIPQPGPDHKGGMMQFHPLTGMFYMSVGDGAYGATAIEPVANDPRTNNGAQETSNLLGSFIRLEMLDSPENNSYYRIPADNPFVGDPNVRDEIWSYGHRNPWRWSFDSLAPYTLWETEVGQSGYEEVNIIQMGGNYGWPICEGTTHRGNAGGDPTVSRSCSGDLIAPVEGYVNPGTASIIGGFVYRGSSLAALNGSFIFGDYNSKALWSVAAGENKTLISNGFPGNISSFGTDQAGEQIFISTHGLEYGGGVSGIYRVIDRDAQAATIPAKLSETGLFADLGSRFPASGVIEYEVNSHGWFDGALVRHFISLPNGQTMDFDETDTWALPVGSVLVKHIDIPVSQTETAPLETSVLFRQVTGWAAANYQWNAAETDADLVTTSTAISVEQYLNGQTLMVDRTIRAGGECGSCHTGVGTRNPRNLVARQLNTSFNYQGVADNQLDVFDAIGLFSQGIMAASSYDAFVDPEDISADVGERAKVYLDTNCVSCHGGSLMDLNYDTPLADMGIMNRAVNGGQFRMLPFVHSSSVLYGFQVTDSNRMPKGTTLTNPVAEQLFRDWINGAGANQTGMKVSVVEAPEAIRMGSPINLAALATYDNGFEAAASGSIFWSSSDSAIVDVASETEATIAVTPAAEGLVTISVNNNGSNASLLLDVLGGPDAPTGFVASALSSTAISLQWNDVSGDETAFVIERAAVSSGPYAEIANLAANTESYTDSGLSPATRYYYRVRGQSADGPSLPASAFADTQEPGNIDGITIVTGNNFQLLAGESRQIVALASANGDNTSATLSAAWSSSNSAVISVSNSGVVTGGSQAGTAVISASLDGVSDEVQITNRGVGEYVYFNNDSTNWPDVRIHVFSTSGGVESPENAWPGDAMEPAIEYGGKWLRFAIVASMQGTQATEVIFNCGSDACQTADLTFDPNGSSWFEDVAATQWLLNEPTGGGAVSNGTQIVVGRGALTWANNGENLSGTLLSPGAVVDVRADDAGTGQVFTQWEGTAAAYMLDPKSPTTKLLVPAALSLTINAVFDTISDDYAAARELYRSTELGCSSCHGLEGAGNTPLTGVAGNYSLASLTSYIAQNMPLGNAAACTGECASSLAELILDEAYLAPEGVCDVGSLNDVVPQDRGYRLLTVYEYNNSVRDILGLGADVDVTSGNLPSDIPVAGFKTGADTIFTDDYAQGYVNAASAVADLAGNTIAGLVPSCGSDTSCIIREFGKKVFRRPLSAAEQSNLQTLHAAEGDRALLITLFSAPAMLYRSEVGELMTSGSATGYYQLSDYEVASLLSYTYWGTTPDNALLALADAGGLSSDTQIRAQTASMLADPRAETAFKRFILGWLNLDKEIGTNALTPSMKADMKEETLRFVSNVVFGGGTYQELITADYSYMTQQLAAHYNIPWPGGSGWQQVQYTGANAERRGVLGHASVLAIQSAQEKTHPVKRGLFVRRNLMCQDFPPPPLGAALDPESDPTQGVRHRFEVSHAQPGCDACHQFIDGIGFGFESYNALGQYVTTETTENGTVLPIDASGYIGSLNSAETFLSANEPVVNYQGLDELSSLIADSSNAKACFARQWFRYARGRVEAPQDSCTLQGYGQSFKETANASLLDLLIDYTQTKNFTLRK